MSKYIGDVSAYAYAVSKGYTGTEEEFAELMADYADVGQTAVTAAQTATAKASEAATSATTATNKATEASTSATSASSSATAASASASAASGSATSAANSATAASGSATAAAGSATTASTKASEASASATAAQTAQTAAEAAQTAAETAQGKAEDAQAAAETTAQSIAASAAQIATNTADIAELKSEVSALPTDGVVANSKQLLSENGTDNTEPYTFRAVPVNADRAELDAVVGGTVCWNQLCNGASVTVQSDHKYLSKIGTAWAVGVSTGTAITGLTSGSDMVIDLTQDFGSTIADYIYSLEQSTAGAGVAFFRKLFPKDYYPYDAGTLKSVEGVSSHDMVGFNQWDEEWEVGGYAGSTGAAWDTNTRIRSKTTNYINVLPNTTYYVKMPSGTNMYLDIMFYNAGKTFISHTDPDAGTTFTTPSDARFMRFASCAAYGATYKNDICINLSDPVKNGTYEPYVKHSYPLDSSLTLRGIPKLDANNNLYYNGDTYSPDGNVKRKFVALTLNGTEDWISGSATNRYFTMIVGEYGFVVMGSVLTDKYVNAPISSSTTEIGITLTNSVARNKAVINIRPEGYADMNTDGFKALLATNNVHVIYEVVEPTTEQADPYQSLQVCDPNGTEEFVTTGIVPVGHETRYPENLRAKIEGLPWDFSSLIAPTEKTTTASRNYTTGSLLIMGNVLYKVTANIANGGTITPGTNVTATTLSEVISALQ